MQRNLFFIFVAVCATVFFIAQASANHCCPKPEPEDPGDGYAGTFSVLKTTDCQKVVSFEVVADDEVREYKKNLKEEYKNAKKKWTEARKEAKKNGEEFSDPRPVMPKVKVLKKGLSKADAEKYREQAEEAKKKQA